VWQTAYALRALESAGEDDHDSAARERCQRGDDVVWVYSQAEASVALDRLLSPTLRNVFKGRVEGL
jgi:hypothetical protein